MNSGKSNNILKPLILAKLRNYLLCTPTSHFGDNFCFTNLSGGKAELILKYRGVNTPSFQEPISIYGNSLITVNCCLMCSKANSRLSGPENMTSPVRKPFQFWRTWAIVVTEPPNEYILSRRYSWIPLLWAVRNDCANAFSTRSFYLHTAEFPLFEMTSLSSAEIIVSLKQCKSKQPEGKCCNKKHKDVCRFCFTACGKIQGRWTSFIEELMQSAVHLEVKRLRYSMDQSWKLLMSPSKWNRKLLNNLKSCWWFIWNYRTLSCTGFKSSLDHSYSAIFRLVWTAVKEVSSLEVWQISLTMLVVIF